MSGGKYTKALNEAVENYKTNVIGSTRWSFANSILYKMCENNPEHKDEDVIVAKIWLIGRTYAAAIERRKLDTNYAGDFYYDKVAPKMLEIGKELDDRINIVKSKPIDKDNLGDILDLHAYLVDHFKTITGLSKRSLASKYLHFHCPKAMFIYDSKASIAIRKLIGKSEEYSNYISNDRDSEYTDFCLRVLELKNRLENEYSLKLGPRELDTFLLSYYDKYLK